MYHAHKIRSHTKVGHKTSIHTLYETTVVRNSCMVGAGDVPKCHLHGASPREKVTLNQRNGYERYNSYAWRVSGNVYRS